MTEGRDDPLDPDGRARRALALAREARGLDPEEDPPEPLLSRGPTDAAERALARAASVLAEVEAGGPAALAREEEAREVLARLRQAAAAPAASVEAPEAPRPRRERRL